MAKSTHVSHINPQLLKLDDPFHSKKPPQKGDDDQKELPSDSSLEPQMHFPHEQSLSEDVAAGRQPKTEPPAD